MANTLHLVNAADFSADLRQVSQDMTEFYCEQCGFRPLPWMVSSFYELLRKGFDSDLLREIISRTARAPRPSWAYLSAIINRCQASAVYDLPAFLCMPRMYRRSDFPEIDPLPY